MAGRDPRPYTGSSVTFACPDDGLPLKTTQPTLIGDISQEAASRGGHLHVDVDVEGTCADGHTWRLHAEMILERR